MKYRNYQVTVNGSNPFPMILPEAITEPEALQAARERWPEAAVKPSGPAEELPDFDSIRSHCREWLKLKSRADILQKLNQVKPDLREYYRAELNRLKSEKSSL